MASHFLPFPDRHSQQQQQQQCFYMLILIESNRILAPHLRHTAHSTHEEEVGEGKWRRKRTNERTNHAVMRFIQSKREIGLDGDSLECSAPLVLLLLLLLL